MRTCAFATVGCKVNQYETQVIREQFLSSGFDEAEINQKADYYIINTCTVTQHSDRDSRSLIRRFRSVNPDAKIIVTGCYVDRDKKAIEGLNCADFIIPNSKKFDISEIALGTEKDRAPIVTQFKGHDRAFIKIQDGCNNFCSYCIVPYVRGRPRSRSIEEIKAEAERLIRNGYLEIVLCGICLGDYGKDRAENMIDLLKELINIDGDFRIRLSSIEPKDISDDLLDLIAGNQKICRHLHIPVQSGDDRILRLMNRPYSHKFFVELAGKVYKRIPGVGISVDAIVGFPTEADKNFKNTLKLLKQIKPIRIHIFTYSPRPGTKAADLKDVVSSEVARKRRASISEISRRVSFAARKKFLKKTLRILIESKLASDKMAIGYADNYLRVKIKPNKIKCPSLISARIKKVDFDDNFGMLVPC